MKRVEKKAKRCRFINESYVDFYLSIPTILASSILLIVFFVGSLFSIVDGNLSFKYIIGLLFLFFCYICYLYIVFKVLIFLSENRKKNDNIILNGLMYKCKIVGFKRIKYWYMWNPWRRHIGRHNAHNKYNESKEAFKLALKYRYGEKEEIFYSDILYIRNLHKVNCDTIYILNDEIYPLLTKGKKNIDKEKDETYQLYKKDIEEIYQLYQKNKKDLNDIKKSFDAEKYAPDSIHASKELKLLRGINFNINLFLIGVGIYALWVSFIFTKFVH